MINSNNFICEHCTVDYEDLSNSFCDFYECCIGELHELSETIDGFVISERICQKYDVCFRIAYK